jgi:hypothetical protein
MEVHVLFDKAGEIVAMSHPQTGRDGRVVRSRFKPGEGQYDAILEVPAHLRQLKPRELHDAVCVRHVEDKPQLVDKTR